MKIRILLAVVVLALARIAEAALYTASSSPNAPIPDGIASGYASSIVFSGLPNVIQHVSVVLNISGGFNGDLYAYLSDGSGFAVLLNRVGRTSANPFGYGDAGFNITLDDSAGNGDIHSYGGNHGGQLNGNWQLDARNVSPLTVTDTSARSAYLSSFNNLDPNGTWTIFFADLSSGGQSTLLSWSLEVVAVPEPVTLALAVFALLALLRGLIGRFWGCPI